MKLSLIRQLWGIDKPWANVFAKFAELGYSGVEIAIPFLEPVEKYKDLLAQNDLQIVPMIFTAGKSVDEHIQSFEQQLRDALVFDPLLVTCHDGRDAFTADEAAKYYSAVLAVENDLGAKVAHETHRGRILYNPWTTAAMLDKFDSLNLCVDFSHWVCVCERLIHDQEDIIRACADRALHIHGRVGYGEGPQVPDPRVEMYRDELEAHEKWWDMVWDSQQARGFTSSTFTPEFGPAPYMQNNPATGEPIADLFEVSNWMAERQRKRFLDTRSDS